MTSPEQALAERIKELRRRQFGPRGKAEFAGRLGVPLHEYERYERGRVPPGETMVRMCELTGEDLQWLLTGVAARGTVVISGTRSRHQTLLTRLAKLLDERPTLASPIEAFVDLLARSEQVAPGAVQKLSPPTPHDLIPIFEPDQLPARLPNISPEDPDAAFPLGVSLSAAIETGRETAALLEPASDYGDAESRPVSVLTMAADDGIARPYLLSPGIAGCFPAMFGVRLRDDTMMPMFHSGDAALASIGSEPKVGHPAVCRLVEDGVVRCRIWLGQDEAGVHLGRLADGETERVNPADVCWSLEVLYRLTAA